MSNSIVAFSSPGIHVTPLWITDHEVREIFGRTRCYYTHTNGYENREATGVFVREQRCKKENALGYVLRNPINGENWLWVISKKSRRPFALTKVR